MNKKLMSVAILVCLTVGCARFSTTQKDVRYDENGKKTTEVSTKAQAYTLFQGKSALAQWKASQTEGEQGAEVGGLNQSTDAGTNIVQGIGGLVDLVNALKTP